MRKIFAIALKDNLVRFSSFSETIFFLILPVVFTFMLGGAGIGRSENTPLLVTDEDNSALSLQLIAELENSGAVRVQTSSQADAEKAFADQKAPAWLTIPAGFEAVALQGDATALNLKKRPNDTAADGAESAVQAAAEAVNRSLAVARNSLNEAERLQPFGSDAVGAEERRAYFTASFTEAQALFSDAPTRMVVTLPEVKAEQRYDQGTQASSGQLVIWVFIPLVGISGLLAYERNTKTLQRLVITPTSKAVYLLATILGQLAAALVQMFILITFAVYVMKINWGGSIPGLALMMVTFGLASAAFGVTLGTFIKTEKQASNLSIMIGMLFSLLGGAMWPMELFPAALRAFAQIFPTYWAMVGFNNLAMRGLGFESVLLPAAALVGFAVVFFAVGVLRFRYE